jgi:hypothetical protein
VAVAQLLAIVPDFDYRRWNLISRRPLTVRKRENRAMRQFESRVIEG